MEDIIKEGQGPAYLRNDRTAVLIVTPEIVELPRNMGNLANLVRIQGGGLADISASLVDKMQEKDVNVHVVVPEHKEELMRKGELGTQEYDLFIKKNRKDEHGVQRIHTLSDDLFRGISNVYEKSEYLTDAQKLRSIAFQRGVLKNVLPKIKNTYDNLLIHCNDWMTGILPAAAQVEGVPSLMTFHNIFTQHETPLNLLRHSFDTSRFLENLYFTEHPASYQDALKHFAHNHVDFLLSGIHSADMVNTVSPTYLEEIVGDHFLDQGFIPNDLRQVVKQRYAEGMAKGILNSPRDEQDPRYDTSLLANYSHLDSRDDGYMGLREGKRINKEGFQEYVGLKVDSDTPLLFWPSRLSSPQKGPELLLDSIDYLMETYDVQVAIVAVGEERFENLAGWYAGRYPGRVAYRRFNRSLSQLGKAGSDFLLMPSLYEPCGLPQLEGPRYGTLPIVRDTGGLSDTVFEMSGDTTSGNGFLFTDFNLEGFCYAVSNAMAFSRRPEDERIAALSRVMEFNRHTFSVDACAEEYIEAYTRILDRRGMPGVH